MLDFLSRVEEGLRGELLCDFFLSHYNVFYNIYSNVWYKSITRNSMTLRRLCDVFTCWHTTVWSASVYDDIYYYSNVFLDYATVSMT